MNTKRLEKSLKNWKKTKDRGSIVHQAETINEQLHVRTIRIRECKEGMKEADRIHALMREKELDRLEELNESHLCDKRMYNLCMKYLKKPKKFDLKEPVVEVKKVEPPKPIERKKHPTIAPPPPMIIVPADTSKKEVDKIIKSFIPPDPTDDMLWEEPKNPTPPIIVPASNVMNVPVSPSPTVEIIGIAIPPDPTDDILWEEPKNPTPPEISELDREIKEAEDKLAKLVDETEFPCPHCGKIYATAPARKRHITMRHKEI